MITYQERKVLSFIRDEIQRTGGVPPTYREMANHLGFRSTQSVHRVMTSLESSGHIRRLFGRARAVEVVERVRWLRWDDEAKALVAMEDAQCRRDETY